MRVEDYGPRPSSAPEPGGEEYRRRKQDSNLNYLFQRCMSYPVLQEHAKIFSTDKGINPSIKDKVDALYDSVIFRTKHTLGGSHMLETQFPDLRKSSFEIERLAQLAQWTQTTLTNQVNDLTSLFRAVSKETTEIELPEDLIERKNFLTGWFYLNRSALAQIETLDLKNCKLSSVPYQLEFFTGLKNLDLSGNKLDDLPNIEALQKLEILNLSHNQFHELPYGICQLSRLTVLNLDHNNISDIPSYFFDYADEHRIRIRLENLKELHLSHNAFVKMPNCFNRFLKITVLDFSHNQIEKLEGNFTELPFVETLSLAHNQISALPRAFNKFAWLKMLDLSENQFVIIPNLTDNHRLRWLNLSHNQIESLEIEKVDDVHMPEMRNLESLHLEHNRIRHLSPTFFEGVDTLQRLYLDYNELEELDFFHGMDSIRLFSARNNQIKRLGSNIDIMKDLQECDLSYNALRELPHEFSYLYRLQKLTIAYNQLVNLPDEFWRLKSLSDLDAEGNKIEELPAQFSTLPLVRLNLQHNELLHLPADINKLKRLRFLDISENLLKEASIPKFKPEVKVRSEFQAEMYWYEKSKEHIRRTSQKMYKFYKFIRG